MTVSAFGCSWSQFWPTLIDCNNYYTDGMGLWGIYEKMQRCDLSHTNAIIVQLPTPIRSHRTKCTLACKTMQLFTEFVQSFEGTAADVAEDIILNRYINECRTIAMAYPQVAFLCFNTGGYPFRAPYDFGENIQEDMLHRIRNRTQRPVLDVTLEGLSGYCMTTGTQEEATKMHGHWSLIHPPNEWILDAHPNAKAIEIAAVAVKDFLNEIG